MMYEKDQIIAISAGNYEDYSVLSVSKVLVPFEAEAVRAEYIKKNPKQEKSYNFETTRFIDYLVERGLVEEVAYQEWHVESNFYQKKNWRYN